MASSVLSFVEDLNGTLKALAHCLKEDGWYVLVILMDRLWFSLVQFDWFNDKDLDYKNGFNEEIAKKVYEACGFDLKESAILDFDLKTEDTCNVFLAIGIKKP